MQSATRPLFVVPEVYRSICFARHHFQGASQILLKMAILAP